MDAGQNVLSVRGRRFKIISVGCKFGNSFCCLSIDNFCYLARGIHVDHLEEKTISSSRSIAKYDIVINGKKLP